MNPLGNQYWLFIWEKEVKSESKLNVNSQGYNLTQKKSIVEANQEKKTCSIILTTIEKPNPAVVFL